MIWYSDLLLSRQIIIIFIAYVILCNSFYGYKYDSIFLQYKF